MELSEQKNVNLFEKYKETKDVSTRNQIILHYGNLVKYIAYSMRNMYLKYAEIDDIVNEGIIALIFAVEHFDESKNVKFETYASIKIRGAIIDFIRKQDFIPRRIRKFAKDMEQAYFNLHNELNREPTSAEMATYLNIDEEKFIKFMGETANINTLSFEEILHEDSIQTINSNSFSDGFDAEQNILSVEKKEVLVKAINSLKEKERLVITLYYYEKMKFQDIALVLDLTESRISQIHSKAILKLKNSILNYMQ